MAIAGVPLTEFLPPASGAASLLLLGGDRHTAAAFRRAGYRVDRHALDTGPLAQLAGVPFTSPAVTWPFPDAAYDVVVLLDELALTMREEEALAEAARVLRPGGILLLRVPGSGPLAWLDGYNAYRYIRDITRRGKLLPEVRGIGWRRHYRRDDLRGLLA
ncbi:MAG: Methyltransferase domain, partial [Thermomicrobiales bacterium]|nr:Methyltransferase domain [Thermomicrobiales bacterium]